MITRPTNTHANVTRRTMVCRRVLPLILITLAGCRTTPTVISPPVTAPPQVLTTLYFGFGLPDGTTISEWDWDAFVESEIVPRFPDGFTLQPADGHWQHQGKPVHEPSRLFSVVHAADAETEVKLEALRTIYCRKFRQDAVLRIDQPTMKVAF